MLIVCKPINANKSSIIKKKKNPDLKKYFIYSMRVIFMLYFNVYTSKRSRSVKQTIVDANRQKKKK